MGIIRWTGRQVVREHSYVAGYHHVGAGWRAMRRNWFRITKTPCPACEEGYLFPMSEVVDGVMQHAMGCNTCNHYIITESPDAAQAQIPDALKAQRERALSILAQPGVRADRLKYFRRLSRMFYLLSFLCLVGSIAFLVLGPKGIGTLAAAMVGVLMFARGFVACYRHWQIAEGQLFVPKAFKLWFKQGAWFV